jgi:hypothetical protein
VGNLGIDGAIILEWILGKWGRKVCTGFIWLRIGISDRFCEHGKEPSVSIKDDEFLDWLS